MLRSRTSLNNVRALKCLLWIAGVVCVLTCFLLEAGNEIEQTFLLCLLIVLRARNPCWVATARSSR